MKDWAVASDDGEEIRIYNPRHMMIESLASAVSK
jgi:hypothetical protein